MDEQHEAPVTPLRGALNAARDGLAGIGDVLYSLSADELAEMMTLADDVKSRAAAAQVRVTAEAAHRGEFASARRGVGSVHSWVREHAPSLRQGGAGQVAQLAQEVAAATPGGLWSCGGPDAGAFADEDRPEGIAWARVVSGEVGAGLALTALREVARMKDLLAEEDVPAVAKAILDCGVESGEAEARKMRPRLLAKYGREGEFDDKQRRLRPGAFLSSPIVADGDLTEYRMAMTPAQATRLEAAIGPLSKPAPNPDTGEADLRCAGQRRVEALDSILTGAASFAGAKRDPGAAPTVLHVTITLADLLAGLSGVNGTAGSGSVLGSRAQRTMLAPSIVRQMACDADVIPLVLGADGEIADLGRVTRLFTLGQRRFLWHRDGQCTFPGCTAPAAWSQAHHVVHWADGGPSDLCNAALLCQRHHTQVHEQRLIATVHPPDEDGRCVTWDLSPGSYDRDLPERLADFARAREGTPAARRRRLDTGPPEGWGSAPPEAVLLDLADEFEAGHLAWSGKDSAQWEEEAAQRQDEDDAISWELSA